jgi:hypothetical protein
MFASPFPGCRPRVPHAPCGAKRPKIRHAPILRGGRKPWLELHGNNPGQDEVDKMFADFVHMQLKCLREYTELLPAEEMDRRHEITREILRKAGAHYVVDTMADLPGVVDDINIRLARGEKP